MKKIILASTSPRRRELLQHIGVPFEAIGSNYIEDMTINLEPHDLVKLLSRGKAEEVAARSEHAIVIGADTFVVSEGKIMGKPKDNDVATKMLEDISGKSVAVITGYTIIDTDTGKTQSEAVETKVWFKKFNKAEIAEYVATGEPLERAGAFGMQDLSLLFIERLEGDFFNAVGLPLSHLVVSLEKFGINIWELRKQSSK